MSPLGHQTLHDVNYTRLVTPYATQAAASTNMRMMKLTGLDGVNFEVSELDFEARSKRLRSCEPVSLYHATESEYWASIQKEGLHLGIGGSLGPGIYLAEVPAQTLPKAKNGRLEGPYVIIRAEVRLGNVKRLQKTDSTLNLRSLLAEGFDSVRLEYFPTGIEFCVYHEDQVPKRKMAVFDRGVR